MSSSGTSSTGKGRIVLVTGATGYIATALISDLLSHGYHVRGTVRSLTSSATISFRELFPSVELFVCDLLSANSFPPAISGCSIIFHCASPFFFGKSTNPQKDFIDPAVIGTENVLKPAFAEKSVERIVITSSVAAIVRNNVDFTTHVFSEEDWNVTSTIKSPYIYSKYLAERRGWELYEQHRSNGGKKLFFSINPGLVLGPPFAPRADAESLRYISTIFNATKTFPEGLLPPSLATRNVWVDVRDVAQAHRIAGEKQGLKSSRYLLARGPAVHAVEISEVLEKLSDKNRTQVFPKKYQPGVKFFPGMKVDNSKTTKELGIQFIGLEKCLKDMTQKMTEFGMLKTETNTKAKL